MSITVTDLDWTYHNTDIHVHNGSHYARHTIDLIGEIKFGGERYCVVYQNGLSYRNGNYSAPCITPELSEEGGTHPTLIKIDDTDFEDINSEFITELSDPAIDTVTGARCIKKILDYNAECAESLYMHVFGTGETPNFMLEDE